MSLSKAIFFHHKRHPFPPSHNLLSTKENGYYFVVRSKSSRCNTGASHRFKAFSPLFCAKNRFRLVLPENSAEIYFDRALNRGSQDGAVSPHMVALLTSVRNSPCFGGLRRTKTCHRQLFARPSVFLRYFLHAAKSTNPFPLREAPRFCKPRFSLPQWRLRTNKIKTFLKEGIEVLQTSIQRTQTTTLHKPN